MRENLGAKGNYAVILYFNFLVYVTKVLYTRDTDFP